METRRWTNPSQPQTLQIAVFLLYANVVLTILFTAWLPAILLALVGGLGAYGIANSQRWGYRLAVASSAIEIVLVVLIPLLSIGPDLAFDLRWLISIVFPVALFCALVHPESREHQRIWFD
ncbi:MAG TPA: hypothetical protein VD926_14895 [Acidimicrobiales bacterium]|nr:hypothetical protein [Acidimicrobiales bacterium]